MTATVHDRALGNLLGLEGIDHLEWWVGNARAFSAFMASGFGFDIVAYAGPILVVMIRRMLQEQLDALAKGEDPIGVSFDANAPPVEFEAGNYIREA